MKTLFEDLIFLWMENALHFKTMGDYQEIVRLFEERWGTINFKSGKHGNKICPCDDCHKS